VVAGGEGGAGGAGEVIPNGLFVSAFDGFADAVPSFGAGEEGLADVEAETVVVGIEEPGGDIVAAVVVVLHRGRVEDIQTQQPG